ALQAMMVPTNVLSGLQAASFNVAAAPLGLTVIALLGLAVAMLPYGLPGRRLGWLLMAPALFWWPNRPPQGGWDLHALDVGQGSAIVIRTARHAVLFDTGLRTSASSDVGLRTVWPFLRSQGINRLGALIVSHADIDHAGGARSMLEALPVQQTYSAFDLRAYLEREARLLGVPGQLPPLPPVMSRCEYGMTWHVDGVSLEFLWALAAHSRPRDRSASRNARNHPACVLRVRGRHHSALFPAAIGKLQEAALVDRGLGSVDVVLAPHHGSKTSSR